MSKVSIVCAAYNCAGYLPKTIESVINQAYPDWELLIVNDCSTDNTAEVTESYAQADDRIKLLNNIKNVGPAKTRNNGIEAAQGKYLAFLDGDDFWEPDFISTSRDYLKRTGEVFCFSSYYRVDEDLNPLYDPFIVPEKVNYESILRTCPISCLTAFIDIEQIGKYYMPNIEKRQDYGLWLNILKDVNFAYGIEKPLATYRIRKGSVSRNKWKAMYYVWKVYRDVEKINLFKSMYLLVVYALNGMKKYSR
ncbi:glycosyl transferase [Owenweeksia hongkongensis DSM 17368]|uniref:Glycosyl transferase n=1 Tax=Owenweeksia hongkongensis (strain DSM 17368 / CIP 108786 / JCM 12287 / NRRL B-23963 / UST20020801) TaxID=926562 RepID=G8R4V1_OWEHD|nr:glycosyltransferase family 2 protein [Owenweeksia hongkongensis]AEV34265.1 glycosyl transferase [Owenweeksia hongkongensis DSM 17368]